MNLLEVGACERYPDFVVASLGAVRKDKPRGIVTARVLVDGTNGIPVNTRTKIRGQERTPVTSDLKCIMKENARIGERTFPLTADFLECQVEVVDGVFMNIMEHLASPPPPPRIIGLDFRRPTDDSRNKYLSDQRPAGTNSYPTTFTWRQVARITVPPFSRSLCFALQPEFACLSFLGDSWPLRTSELITEPW